MGSSTSVKKSKKPLLFFSTQYFMYIGKAVDTVVHDHHAIQIAISFEDTIEMILTDATFQLKGFIIDSDVPHECRTKDTTFLLISVDPECKIGKGLRKVCLAGKKTASLPEDIVEKLLSAIKPLLSVDPDMDRVFEVTLRFLHELSHTVTGDELDDRISKILEVLNQPGDAPLKVKELAEIVYLSPGRLIHLFTSQVGIPIRKYALWAKLLISLQQIIQTRDMTAAALEGGFSDAPHFNRTFKRMFGLSPTSLLENSQIIQARLQ